MHSFRSRVEDMQRGASAQPDDSQESGSSKWSKPMQVVTGIYILILLGAVVLAGLFFVNFNLSVFGGPSASSGGNMPFVVQPNENFTYKMTAVFKSEGNFWRVGILENGTHYYDLVKPCTTLTSSCTQRVWASLESNESFYGWTYTYYPDGRNETYQHDGAVGMGLIPNQNTQAGTYTIGIKNTGSQETHATIKLQFTEEVFEKPYFYYGIAAFVIALVGPILFIVKRIV